MKYKTIIIQSGNNTGIEVPEEIVESLGAGKRPPVVLTLNGYTYRSTIAVMGGKFLIPLSAEHRKNAKVSGGDAVEITIALDTEPRIIELPAELEERMTKNTKASEFYNSLAPSAKKKIVMLVESAKTDETRNKRIEKIMSDLESNIKI